MPANKGEAYTGNADMMKNSSYLRAYHLQGKEVTVEIESAQTEKVKNKEGKERKMLVLYFAGKSLGLGLCNENIDTIKELYGKTVKDWFGKRITLFAKKVNAFGEMVEAIRIRPTVPAKARDAHGEPDPDLTQQPEDETLPLDD